MNRHVVPLIRLYWPVSFRFPIIFPSCFTLFFYIICLFVPVFRYSVDSFNMNRHCEFLIRLYCPVSFRFNFFYFCLVSPPFLHQLLFCSCPSIFNVSFSMNRHLVGPYLLFACFVSILLFFISVLFHHHFYFSCPFVHAFRFSTFLSL